MTTDTGYLDHGHQPGGRLDAQKHDQHHQAATDPGHGDGALPAGYVLSVAEVMPAEAIPRCVILSAANPFLPILPRDMARRRAVLCAIDNDVVFVETVELAQLVAAAVAGGAAATTLANGGYWPKGVALPVESRDRLYVVATTTASTSRVTLFVERHAQQPAL
jgi:hypothetical protein